MKNNHENRVPVDIEKLSHGLRTTFIGVAEVFDSIGAEEKPGFGVVEETTEEQVQNTAEPVVNSDETGTDKAVDSTAVDDSAAEDTVEEAAGEDTSANDTAVENTTTEKSSEKTADKSSITIDDLIKVTAKKIKKKGNSEKIAALVRSYGKSTLKEIPPEKIEAFMTDLAEI